MKKLFFSFALCSILFVASAQYNSVTCNTPMLISTGTIAINGDDDIAGITLPFSFTFYGVAYNDVYISTNGFISFDANASHGCCSGYELPYSQTASYIALAHTDLYVPSATAGEEGSVFYDVVGSAPNRVFIVHYESAYACCDADPVVTGEIQLYETTNEIKIVTTGINSPFNNTTMGIAKGDDLTSTIISSRNNVTFSTGNECWSLINSATLPLTLLKFSGHTLGINNNLLEWTTSYERNTLSFDIQRSTNGIDFTTVRSLPAAGTSNADKDYYYNDDVSQVKAATYYYRLKMVDKNAVYKYSAIVRIKVNNSDFVIESSPNPFTNHVTVHIQSAKQDDASIIMTDINGRMLLQKTYKLNNGNNAIDLDIPKNIQPGVYMLRVISTYQDKTFKLIKL